MIVAMLRVLLGRGRRLVASEEGGGGDSNSILFYLS